MHCRSLKANKKIPFAQNDSPQLWEKIAAQANVAYEK